MLFGYAIRKERQKTNDLFFSRDHREAEEGNNGRKVVSETKARRENAS